MSEVNAYALVRQAKWDLDQYLSYVHPHQPTVLIKVAKRLEEAQEEMFNNNWRATRKPAPLRPTDGEPTP